MTKEEALDWLISRKEHYEMDDNCQELAEAIGIGIDAIEQELCEDVVSKQAVAEVLLKYVRPGDDVGKRFVEFLLSQINALSPVNPPQPKAGRCKDCKHFRELPHHTVTLGRCNFHDLRFYPKGDWYCADFEPKESEV